MTEKNSADGSSNGRVWHPAKPGEAASQQLVDALWEWYSSVAVVNNVIGGEKLPRGRTVVMASVWLAESGTAFTASIRAREKGRSDREWVIYSTAANPFDALRLVTAAAKDEQTAWKEKPRVDQAGAQGSSPKLPDPMKL